MMERIGIQALCVLIVVWVYFLVKYFTGLQFPVLLDTVMLVIGIASGIGVFLWLTKHSQRL
jgi:nicotinamide riboside transporter PnuC